ncbi:hypothetical protein BDV93DRAFT_510375 [Ceratobasidium sp. AG-I]|nr:hypothetical protein BDV93DRAFT_510375 [Ceratobasidium sp. AG-I]
MKADVYALGMETITGRSPYTGKPDPTVMGLVMIRKQLPPRPVDLISEDSNHGRKLWKILEQCWSHNPELRPGVAAVRDVFVLVPWLSNIHKLSQEYRRTEPATLTALEHVVHN